MARPPFSTTRLLERSRSAGMDDKTPSAAMRGGLRMNGFVKRSRPGLPLVTVATVSYNAAADIEDTIRSVLEQTYDNVEYLVIDGGSTDGTVDIIRAHEHAIDLWICEPDRGIYDAMNKGIALGTGDWFSFMNAGDRFAGDDVLALFCDARFDAHAPGIAYGDTIVVDAQSREILSSAGELRLRDFHYDTPVCHQSLFTNRMAFEAVGAYSADLKLMADLDWLVRFMRLGATRTCNRYRVDRPVARYRIGGKGYSSGERNYLERWRVARAYFPLRVRARYLIGFPLEMVLIRLRRLAKLILGDSAIAYRWRRWRMGGSLSP
ncbi:MAG TPA: glycosyltransferase family 2 protein [Spirochaetota bacterium]|nr:glycosyltransferase family 2 protein [Spirochaetota bacterium]HOS41404.1 glycosyltransferase family 2 protein [Spirochaetota bacterium]HPI23922.1 glycosyltransferase family 2 protein [Spirochaetota bacterium]HPU89298.1 glycosyltransferase family 2 protein [Spirochaetota bacterium]